MRATIVGVLSGKSRWRLERRGRGCFVLRVASCWRSARSEDDDEGDDQDDVEREGEVEHRHGGLCCR
jgi:hypothetical protein